jgi:hypothetical protein
VVDKRREVVFMVFTVEPRFVSTLERSIQRKIKEVTNRVRLDAYTANELSLSRTRMILQEEIVLEKWKIGVDGKIALTEVKKYDDLKNGIRIEVN